MKGTIEREEGQELKANRGKGTMKENKKRDKKGKREEVKGTLFIHSSDARGRGAVELEENFWP